MSHDVKTWPCAASEICHWNSISDSFVAAGHIPAASNGRRYPSSRRGWFPVEATPIASIGKEKVTHAAACF
jgi:hypothetical protein